jgi:O-antigen/teichoic acid export membrane protein
MVGILIASLLTFVISPEEVGACNLALSIVSFGALVGALGLPKTVVRLVAENVGLNRFRRMQRVIYTVLRLGLVGTLLTSLAYFLVIGDLIERRLFESPLLVDLTGLIAIWIAMAILQEITAETFRGFHDIRWATLLGGLATGGKSGGLIMRLVLFGILTLLVVKGAGVDLRTVTLISIGAGSVSVLLSCWLLYGKVSSLGSRATEEPVSTREVLDDALPFLAIAMTAFVLQAADIWILGALDSETAVAVYANASKLVLSAAKLVAVWSGCCGLVLQFTGHQASMLRVSLLTSPLFFVLAIFATMRYGPIGVAAAAALITSLQNVIMVLLAKRKTGMWTHVSFSLSAFRKGPPKKD